MAAQALFVVASLAALALVASVSTGAGGFVAPTVPDLSSGLYSAGRYGYTLDQVDVFENNTGNLSYTFTNATLNVSLYNASVLETVPVTTPATVNSFEDGWLYTNNGLYTKVAAIYPQTTFTGSLSVLSLFNVGANSNPLWFDGTLTMNAGSQILIHLFNEPTAAYTVNIVYSASVTGATTCAKPSGVTYVNCGIYACWITAIPIATGDYTGCYWVLNVNLVETLASSASFTDGITTITASAVELVSFTQTYTNFVVTIDSTSTTQINSLFNGIIDLYNSQLYIAGTGATFKGAGHVLLQLSSTMYVNAIWTITETFFFTIETGSEIVVSTASSMTQTAVGNPGLFIAGTMSGSSLFTSTRGSLWLLTGAVLSAPTSIGANTAASNSRSLLATTVSAITYVCGSEFGSGTVTVLSGGNLQAKTSCTYGTVTDSNAATVTASASTSTTVTTATTVNNGGYLTFDEVSATSNLVNFNGELTFVSGSTIVVTLLTMPSGTDRWSADVARYLSTSCQLTNAAYTFTNCQGEFTCSVSVYEELAGTSCRIKVTVEDNDTSQESLYYLFFLLLIVPVVAAVALVASKKSKSPAPEVADDFPEVAQVPYGYPNPYPTPIQTPPMYSMPVL